MPESYLNLSAFSYSMATIIDKAKEKFFQTVDKFASDDPHHKRTHVLEVEKCAEYILKKCPQADKKVVRIAAWLHDIGYYPIPTEIDHAARSEERAKEFLEKESYGDKTDEVLHCVRAHRCKDVKPETLEAKIIACADSASHMTEPVYFEMAKDYKKSGKSFEEIYAKMERDYRDLTAFPEIQSELKGLYEAWKKLIETYEKLDLK